MKKVFFALFLIAAISAKAQKTSIVVEVENFRNEKGVCRAYLFDNDKNFPSESDKAVASKSVKVNGSKAALTFENVPTGTYAIAIIHDENNNRHSPQKNLKLLFIDFPIFIILNQLAYKYLN